MKPVLIAYASRLGSTQEIAWAIGDQLAGRGFDVEVTSAADAARARGFAAVLLGSAVYMGQWDKRAVDYLRRGATELAQRSTWLFQNGPGGPIAENRPHRHAAGREEAMPHHWPRRTRDLWRESRRPGLEPDPGLGRRHRRPAHRHRGPDRVLIAGVDADNFVGQHLIVWTVSAVRHRGIDPVEFEACPQPLGGSRSRIEPGKDECRHVPRLWRHSPRGITDNSSRPQVDQKCLAAE